MSDSNGLSLDSVVRHGGGGENLRSLAQASKEEATDARGVRRDRPNLGIRVVPAEAEEFLGDGVGRRDPAAMQEVAPLAKQGARQKFDRSAMLGVEAPAKLDRLIECRFILGRSEAMHRHLYVPERERQLGLAQEPAGSIGDLAGKREAPPEMHTGLRHRRAGCGLLAGTKEVNDGLVHLAGLGEVVAKQSGSGRHDIGVALEGLADCGVQRHPTGAQQAVIGRVLHQRVLEVIGCLRRLATTENEAGGDELIESCVQDCRRHVCYFGDHRVREVAPEHRADLGNLFRGRHPVKACQQRRLQSGRHSDCRGFGLRLRGGLQHAFGQLFDEERYPVGLADDPLKQRRRQHRTDCHLQG
jgi:hypothetical protein